MFMLELQFLTTFLKFRLDMYTNLNNIIWNYFIRNLHCHFPDIF